MLARPQVSRVGFVGAMPWFSLGLLLAFAALAYLQVGHWPLYNRPDPKDVALGFAPGARIGGVFVLLIFLSVPASVIAVVVVSFFLLCRLAENGWSLTDKTSSSALITFSSSG